MAKEKSRGSELREARIAGGLSLWDVARRAGITANELSLIERNCRHVEETIYDTLQQAVIDITRERHEAACAATGGKP